MKQAANGDRDAEMMKQPAGDDSDAAAMVQPADPGSDAEATKHATDGDSDSGAMKQAAAVARLLEHTLGERLEGVFLHGSLATNSFQAGRSDIDMLAVFDGVVSDTEKAILARRLLRLSGSPHPVELHVCPADGLYPWRHPARFSFHYSEAWRERLAAALDRANEAEELRTLAAFAGAEDIDLAAHVRSARERGIALLGRPPQEALPLVPDADFLASIAADADAPLRDVSKRPVYYVLNWLRVLRFAEDGSLLSKEEAGVWGLTALPLHIEVVADALNLYRRPPAPQEALHFDVEPLRAFLRACRAQLG